MNVDSTNNVASYIDEALCLVLVRRMGENTSSKCVRSHSVPPKRRNLSSQDSEDLAQEPLHKAVQAASLPQTAGLPDVEEVQVAKMVIYPCSRYIGRWGQVDPNVWQGCWSSKKEGWVATEF